MTDSEPTVRFVPEGSRYDLLLEGRVVGRADFRRRGEVADIFHTEVDPELQGHGLAGVMTDFALADLESQGLTVEPSCSYVRARMAAR